MNYFFFYNKMTTDEMITKISTNNTLEDAIIYIDSYDKIKQLISFTDNNYNSNGNKIKLPGKLCSFELSLVEILEKINSIDEIKTHGYTYTIEKIKVKKSFDDSEIESYIIY